MKRLAEWADVFVTNYPPPVRKRLKVTYDDVARYNPRLIYADVTGFGDCGPDADAPGFDLTAYWARSGLLAMMHDAGCPPTLAPSGSGDHATAVGLYGSIVTALYRRERTGKGGYVTTSLIAEGTWSAAVYVQAALCGATFYPPHDRLKPSSALINPYPTSDGIWLMLVARDQEWPGLTAVIGQPTLLDDERFVESFESRGKRGGAGGDPRSRFAERSARALARAALARAHHLRRRADAGAGHRGSGAPLQ